MDGSRNSRFRDENGCAFFAKSVPRQDSPRASFCLYPTPIKPKPDSKTAFPIFERRPQSDRSRVRRARRPFPFLWDRQKNDCSTTKNRGEDENIFGFVLKQIYHPPTNARFVTERRRFRAPEKRSWEILFFLFSRKKGTRGAPSMAKLPPLSFTTIVKQWRVSGSGFGHCGQPGA